MTALQVDQVVKHFDDTVAADHVSFELGDHELLALVGPSGCGKSTLLRMIAGLLPVEAGTITLGDEVVEGGQRVVPPEQRHIGLVFQEHALFPHLTVAGNVGFGVRTGDRESVVGEMLGLVGLVGYGSRYPHELSGGERQRVALARALAPRPSLLLLDEPFASLDPNLRAQVRDDVVSILRSTRTPAVFVTHDQHEALAAGDRVAVMRAGQIVQIDTPDRVFHEPSNRFVAAFMGEASFVSGAVIGSEVEGATVDALSNSTIFMLRPDDVTFRPSVPRSGDVPDDQANDVAEVIGAEFRGSSWRYTLRLPSGAHVRSTRSHLERIDVGTKVVPMLRSGHRPVPIPGD